MMRHVFTIKSSLIKASMLGLVLTLMPVGSVFAAANENQTVKIQTKSTANENALIQKQNEIDKNVFEKYSGEIANKGFTVTHTGPMDGYVEVGITPYNESNAEYLYKIIGRDMVKVVEGNQAVLLKGAATTTLAAPEKNNAETSASIPIIYTLVIAGTLGGAGFVLRKKLAAK